MLVSGVCVVFGILKIDRALGRLRRAEEEAERAQEEAERMEREAEEASRRRGCNFVRSCHIVADRVVS